MENFKYRYFISIIHGGPKDGPEGVTGYSCTTLHSDTRLEDQIINDLESIHKDISDKLGVRSPVLLYFKQL